MLGPTKAPRFSRVVVALGAASPQKPALEAGFGLAAAVGAALEGLFVEDANLVRLASLPFATETCALTGARRNLATEDVERALRVEAARLEQRLASSAARTQVRWSFAVARGELFTQAAARQGDLLVLGTHARAPPRPGPVAVLFDASPEARRALVAATRFARALSCALLILVPGNDAAPQRAVLKRAREWLAAEGIGGVALALAPDQRALIAAVRARGGLVLTLPEPALAAWPLDLAALVTAIACPLVIAR